MIVNVVEGNRKENVTFTIFENFNSVDLTVYQCGREKCQPGHLFGPAVRRHYLLHYILKGKGFLISPDASGVNQTYSLQAGQGFLLYPDTLTTYYADGEDPWEYIWLEFDGLKVTPALEQTTMRPAYPIYESIDNNQRDIMVNEMQFLLEHAKSSPYLICGHLYLFLEAFIQSARIPDLVESNSLADYYVRETIAFIENNYTRNISIEDIAASLGVSRSYLTKIFKRIMRQPPQKFLMAYRMSKAAALLRTTDLKISEIALKVGYEKQMHFSRAFKQAYNTTPSTWRNQNRLHPVQMVVKM